jgi:hypothetical protein
MDVGTKATLIQTVLGDPEQTDRVRTVKVVDTNLATPGLVRIEYIDKQPIDSAYTGRFGYVFAKDLTEVTA